jgi:integrase
MPRPPGVQITRDRRKDGSITFSLRVRIAGADERVPLGNTGDGWDEIRAETARNQLLAKIELGLWAPRKGTPSEPYGDEEPTFRELATDWLANRKRNPAIRPRTIQFNETQLKRYLAPFFGELRSSQITVATIKRYREGIHLENEQIRNAAAAGKPLRNARTGQSLRTLGNASINQTLRTLALILDEAEDAGWIERNAARAKRTREPAERRRQRGVLDVDEFLDLLEAAGQIDGVHKPATLEKANSVRALRDEAGLNWKAIGARVGVAPTTAIYLYGCAADQNGASWGPRRPIIATLGLAGLRVGELCQLDNQDVNLGRARLHIGDAKTQAGVRSVDIQPRLLDELSGYRGSRPDTRAEAPAFPTRNGTRRDRSNILTRVIAPAVTRANVLRARRGEPAIRTHVTPHTFRRSYISYMVAAGYDLPYIQAQVGHRNPSTTLAIYAQVIARPDRDQLRAEIHQLFGADRAVERPSLALAARSPRPQLDAIRLRATSIEKAGKGRTLRP